MRNSHFSFSSQILNEFDRFLKIVTTVPQSPTIPTPLTNQKEADLTSDDINNIQGLMRINHTGEVCAQALYYGQALFAKDPTTHKHLIKAASEEHDHLYWCYERITDLNTHTSILNPFWYASSFALGATAAFFGDKVSYGFVIEVEKQVENHLQEHMDQVPNNDKKTHAILSTMQIDEIRHGKEAKQAGGIDLPKPVKKIMTGMSKLMKYLVYRV